MQASAALGQSSSDAGCRNIHNEQLCSFGWDCEDRNVRLIKKFLSESVTLIAIAIGSL